MVQMPKPPQQKPASTRKPASTGGVPVKPPTPPKYSVGVSPVTLRNTNTAPEHTRGLWKHPPRKKPLIKAGRPPIFEDAQTLEDAWRAYDAYRKHPDNAIEVGRRGRTMARPPSIHAFATFCGFSTRTFANFIIRQHGQQTDEEHADMQETALWITDCIKAALLEMGMLKSYDAGLVKALTGLEKDTTAPTAPTAPASTPAQLTYNATQYHPDDTACVGPLYTRAQIAAGVKYIPHGEVIDR